MSFDRFDVVRDRLELNWKVGFSWCEDYAEPGYTAGERGVAFGNWNHAEREGDILEKMGFSIEWHDEWATCGGCYKAVRTQADSYSWVPSYKLGDGEIYCKDCLLDDPEDYIRSVLIDEGGSETFGLMLSKHGFQLDGSFESGFHEGQIADPRQELEKIRKLTDRNPVLQIDNVGQFDTHWSIWSREYDYEEPED